MPVYAGTQQQEGKTGLRTGIGRDWKGDYCVRVLEGGIDGERVRRFNPSFLSHSSPHFYPKHAVCQTALHACPLVFSPVFNTIKPLACHDAGGVLLVWHPGSSNKLPFRESFT